MQASKTQAERETCRKNYRKRENTNTENLCRDGRLFAAQEANPVCERVESGETKREVVREKVVSVDPESAEKRE